MRYLGLTAQQVHADACRCERCGHYTAAAYWRRVLEERF